MANNKSIVHKDTLPYFNVIHFAFNYFRVAAPTSKRAYKNGTEYEILCLLTDSVIHEGKTTTHLLVTFSTVDEVSYEKYILGKDSNIVVKLTLPINVY